MDLHRWLASAWIALFFLFSVVPAKSQSTDSRLQLPDAPSAHLEQVAAQNNSPSTETSNSGSQVSSSQDGARSNAQTNQPLSAEEQLKRQEKQRIMGLVPTFNTTLDRNALPLSPRQKFRLFFKSVTDPWPFGLTAVAAGIDQAQDSSPEYGQGMQGYAKRYGASYTDYFTGNFFGNALLPSLMHEDPRYFQKGTGSIMGRALWAAGSTVWSRRDNSTWGPNYSNILGNLIGSSISNLYYPESDRTVGDTFERAFVVTAEGGLGSELIEFWPDVVRHYQRKKAAKLARQAGENGAQKTPQPNTSPSSNPQN